MFHPTGLGWALIASGVVWLMSGIAIYVLATM